MTEFVIIQWKQEISTGVNQSKIETFTSKISSFNRFGEFKQSSIDLIVNGLKSEGAFDLSIETY